MSKKKRTYEAEVAAAPSLQLRQPRDLDEKQSGQSDQKIAKKEFFSQELISRLADRIKKL